MEQPNTEPSHPSLEKKLPSNALERHWETREPLWARAHQKALLESQPAKILQALSVLSTLVAELQSRWPRSQLTRHITAEWSALWTGAFSNTHTSFEKGHLTFFQRVRLNHHEHMKRTLPWLMICVVLFLLSGVFGYTLSASFGEKARYFMPPHLRDSLDRGEMWTSSIIGVEIFSGAGIAINNIIVTWVCFLSGVFLGIPSLIINVVNGVSSGMILSELNLWNKQILLWQFMFSHGILEIFTIIVSSAFGFRLMIVFQHAPHGQKFRSLMPEFLASASSCFILSLWLILCGIVEANISPLLGKSQNDSALYLAILIGSSVFGLYFLTHHYGVKNYASNSSSVPNASRI